MDTLSATAYVEEINKDKIRVRLNFVHERKISSGYGMESINDIPVEDGIFYQEVFQKIDKAIFLRKNSN